MKEITVVTTVEATDIIRFEDSPDAYEGILNFMGKARKDIADSAAKQFAESDDVNVKVQFFVNDADSASSDKVGDNLQSVDKCKRD